MDDILDELESVAAEAGRGTAVALGVRNCTAGVGGRVSRVGVGGTNEENSGGSGYR